MNARLLAAGLLFVGACAAPTKPVAPSLKVVADGTAFHLTNPSDRAIFYFILERNSGALVDWVQCVDPSFCPFVAPGAQVSVPYADIFGYSPGANEAIVYWWQVALTPIEVPKRPAAPRSPAATVPGALHWSVVAF